MGRDRLQASVRRLSQLLHPDREVNISLLQERNLDSLEKQLIPGMGQGKYKMSLEHIVTKNRKH